MGGTGKLDLHLQLACRVAGVVGVRVEQVARVSLPDVVEQIDVAEVVEQAGREGGIRIGGPGHLRQDLADDGAANGVARESGRGQGLARAPVAGTARNDQ